MTTDLAPWTDVHRVLTTHMLRLDLAGYRLADEILISGVGRPGCPAVLRPRRALTRDEALAAAQVWADVYGQFGEPGEADEWRDEQFIARTIEMLTRPNPNARTRSDREAEDEWGLRTVTLRQACAAL